MKLYQKLTASIILMLSVTACCGNDITIKNVNQFIAEQSIDKSNPSWKTKLNKPPLFTFTENKNYFWHLETTQGDITLKLFTDSAPMHVSSTIYLTNLGFYDDLTFHRVIPGFMAQGGDPKGSGRGNPGYSYQGEFTGDTSHDKAGILSMANAGPGTDGSQFFITFKPTQFLDGKHTVFGEVVEGSDTLAKMESLGSRRGKTKDKISIIKASILVKNKQQ